MEAQGSSPAAGDPPNLSSAAQAVSLEGEGPSARSWELCPHRLHHREELETVTKRSVLCASCVPNETVRLLELTSRWGRAGTRHRRNEGTERGWQALSGELDQGGGEWRRATGVVWEGPLRSTGLRAEREQVMERPRRTVFQAEGQQGKGGWGELGVLFKEE